MRSPSERSSSRAPRLPRAGVIGGLLLLIGGMVVLHGVFRQERREALRAVEDERAFLALRAREELESRLEAALRAGADDRRRAREDPRVPAQSLLWWKEGRQILPRVFRFAEERDPGRPPLSAVLESLETGNADLEARDDSPWAERRALLRDFEAALEAGETRTVESVFRDFLEHRRNFRIDGVRDLAGTLVLLEVFQARGDPHPRLMQRLLVEGVEDGRGGELAPLDAELLRLRPRLEREEFALFLERLGRLGDAAGVDLGPLRARAAEEEGRALPFDPGSGGARRALWDGGRWFVESREDAECHGVAVDLPALAEGILEVLSSASSSGERAELEILPPAEGAGLEELELRLWSPRWSEQGERVRARHRVKSGLLALTSALGVLLTVLMLGHQRRRERLLRLQSDFVAAVSHELRTPLASVRLMAETLERRRGEDSDYPRRIVRAVDGLHFLVENVLSFQRLGRGAARLERRPVELRDLLEGVEEKLRDRAPRPLSVVRDFAPGVELWADAALLELVLTNLLLNGSLYNEHEVAKIRVRHRREGGRDRVWVEDDGWGLSEEEAAHAFERFWRGRDPSRPKVPGTGLGLAICRLVLELHGGSIVLEHSGPEGSRFRLDLPAGGEGAAEARRP